VKAEVGSVEATAGLAGLLAHIRAELGAVGLTYLKESVKMRGASASLLKISNIVHGCAILTTSIQGEDAKRRYVQLSSLYADIVKAIVEAEKEGK
jgi:flagellin-specific chaperone FliS